MMNIHTTCIMLNGKGVLLMGCSGSGKSDLALRLIRHYNAVLVADDRTDIVIEQEKAVASCPKSISGLLEVRGVGILKMPFQASCRVDLVVELARSFSDVERLPSERFYELGGIKIPLLKIYPFEASAPDKIVIKLETSID